MAYGFNADKSKKTGVASVLTKSLSWNTSQTYATVLSAIYAELAPIADAVLYVDILYNNATTRFTVTRISDTEIDLSSLWGKFGGSTQLATNKEVLKLCASYNDNDYVCGREQYDSHSIAWYEYVASNTYGGFNYPVSVNIIYLG